MLKGALDIFSSKFFCLLSSFNRIFQPRDSQTPGRLVEEGVEGGFELTSKQKKKKNLHVEIFLCQQINTIKDLKKKI